MSKVSILFSALFSVLFSVLFAFLCLTSNAMAQTGNSNAAFRAALAEFQKNPVDRKLREAVIKQALALKPPPPMPNGVVKLEGRAEYAFKNAKDANGFQLA